MTHLIGLMIDKANDCERVYCSVWHLPHKEHSELHSILSQYGFKVVIPNRGKWVLDYNCYNCDVIGERYCVHCNMSGCSCTEDLYVLEKEQRKL